MFDTDGIKRNSNYLAKQIKPYNPVAMDQYRTIRGTLGSQTFQRDLVPEMALKGKVVTQAMVKSFSGCFEIVAASVALGLLLLLMLEKPKGPVDTSAAH